LIFSSLRLPGYARATQCPEYFKGSFTRLLIKYLRCIRNSKQFPLTSILSSFDECNLKGEKKKKKEAAEEEEDIEIQLSRN
jgi:hypothetical protein